MVLCCAMNTISSTSYTSDKNISYYNLFPVKNSRIFFSKVLISSVLNEIVIICAWIVCSIGKNGLFFDISLLLYGTFTYIIRHIHIHIGSILLKQYLFLWRYSYVNLFCLIRSFGFHNKILLLYTYSIIYNRIRKKIIAVKSCFFICECMQNVPESETLQNFCIYIRFSRM